MRRIWYVVFIEHLPLHNTLVFRTQRTKYQHRSIRIGQKHHTRYILRTDLRRALNVRGLFTNQAQGTVLHARGFRCVRS